jgi:hypothetical protein
MTAHVDYWQAEGLRRASRNVDIPFLILCHENYLIPKTYEMRKKEFLSVDFKFGGTAIAVFSQKMKRFFVEARVCEPEQLVVTGPPRFDGWRSLSVTPSKIIVLLSYLGPMKYYADDDFFETVNVVRRTVMRNADWKLIIKCKGLTDERAINRRVNAEERVVISHELPIAELLAEASVVVGSNSLSLLEALISSAKLIMPVTPAAMQNPDTMMLDVTDPQVRDCISIVTSMSDLESEIEIAMRTPLGEFNHEERFSLLQRFLFVRQDEPASERVIGFIEKHVRT